MKGISGKRRWFEEATGRGVMVVFASSQACWVGEKWVRDNVYYGTVLDRVTGIEVRREFDFAEVRRLRGQSIVLW